MLTVAKLEAELLEELDTNIEDIKSSDDQYGYISEVVDRIMPLHYQDYLTLAINDLYLATDEPEVLAFDGSTTALNCIAGNVYEALRVVAEDWAITHKINY